MKLYGIKTCGSVRKAIKFFNENNLEYEFIDFKKISVDKNKINEWLKKVPMDKLLNNRGTKYRTLKLKELELDNESKKDWLAKENMLIKRPIIEYKNQVIVAFDETEYNKIFSKEAIVPR